MDRLSGLDASFLYLETPAQLMHVCGLIVLDPSTMPEPLLVRRLRDGIEARVRDVPEFTRKLRRVPLGLDHPVWVRDTAVRHRAARAPAGAADARAGTPSSPSWPATSPASRSTAPARSGRCG